jgi:cytochrome c553
MIKPASLVIGMALLVAFPALAADPHAGKAKSAACGACHGADGKTPPGPDFPKLAGQHYDYLVKSLKDYKTGVRTNPIMAPQVANLSEKDLEDLAIYYASQEGGLQLKY